MIRLENISKRFAGPGGEVRALQDVSLRVEAGRITGVIGTSGAGKSTLIRCVNLLERPTAGRVVVDGRDLTALPARDVVLARRQIGMVFQHPNLLSSRTVAGNVALPLELAGAAPATIAGRVAELLALVGVSDKRDAWPAQLSGGQKQRVTIARALANAPRVLLCDEATSALDPATSRSILELLQDINRRLGLTILLITHEMDVVKSICDEVAILSEGRLIEQGSVRDVFAHPQTALARQFIRSTLHLEIPEDYRARLSSYPRPGSHPLLQLELTGRSAGVPVISQISRLFRVDVGIVSSRTDYAAGTKFGLMLVELFGDETAVAQATAYLREHNVEVEVIGHVLGDGNAAA